MRICVIGAGFYGLKISSFLKNNLVGSTVHVYERNKAACTEAIVNNQHRLHTGFHYPRCKFTIEQCKETFDDFEKSFPDCIEGVDRNYYIIHKDSKLNSNEYADSMANMGIKFKIDKGIDPDIPLSNKHQFDSYFLTNEKKINLKQLSESIIKLCRESGVKIYFNSEITKITEETQIILNGKKISYDFIINCSYSSPFLYESSLMETKSELCFMALLKPKRKIKEFSATICDGPFSSLYKADDGHYTLSNVLKTPAFKNVDPGHLREIRKGLSRKEIDVIINNIVEESENYFDIKNNFDLVGHYSAIKTKILKDKNDFRGCFYTRDGNTFNILAGKIQACLLLEDNILKEIKNG